MEEDKDDLSSIDGDINEFLRGHGVKLDESSVVEDDQNGGQDTAVVAPTSLRNSRFPVISSCLSLHKTLANEGIDSIQLRESDINDEFMSISVYVLDAWVGSVSNGVTELVDKLKYYRAAANESAENAARHENVDIKALRRHSETLEIKLVEEEKKTSKLSSLVYELESKLKLQSNAKKAEDINTKKSIKSLEQLNQEMERRNRQKDIEIERLKQKIQQLSTREKESADRNKSTLALLAQESTSLNSSFASLSPSSPLKLSNATNNCSSSSNANGNGSSNISVSMSSVASSVSSNPSTPPRKHSHSHSHSKTVMLADVIAALSSEKKDLIQRVSDLEKENQQFQLLVREQFPNSSLEKRKAALEALKEAENNEEQRSMTAKAMFEKIQEQQKMLQQQQKDIDVLTNRRAESDQLVLNLRDSLMNKQEEIDNFILEINSRPTVKEWNRLQSQLKDCEEKLHDIIMMRGEMAEINAWKQHLSTSERIQIDKRNYELGLWMLDSLPQQVLKEILQAICRELDLNDITEIVPSLQKLKFVVKSVPRMERFISMVTTFVMEHERQSPNPIAKEKLEINDIPAVLKKWWKDLQKLHNLQEFQEVILQELSRREYLLSLSSSDSNRLPLDAVIPLDYWNSIEHSRWRAMSAWKVASVIHDLCDFQMEILTQDNTRRGMESFVKNHPEFVVSRIVSHVQYLFDINQVDGVLPQMNRIYLFVREMQSFLDTCREYFGSSNQSTEAVLHLIRQKIGM